MNEISDVVIQQFKDLSKNVDVKISLSQWPCAVAILGICAAHMFSLWAKRAYCS